MVVFALLCTVCLYYLLYYRYLKYTFQENYVQFREGGQDGVTGAPGFEEVDLVQDLSPTPARPLQLGHQTRRSTYAHVEPCKARKTTDEGQIFSCYCGDNFITPGSFAKHAALHSNGQWKPEQDEDYDEGEEIYLKCSGNGSAAVETHGAEVEVMSVSSSTSFFTAQTHQGSL